MKASGTFSDKGEVIADNASSLDMTN